MRYWNESPSSNQMQMPAHNDYDDKVLVFNSLLFIVLLALLAMLATKIVKSIEPPLEYNADSKQ